MTMLAEPAPPSASVPELAPATIADLPQSTYLQYLPAPFHGDDFLNRFLLIFESILGPIERVIDTLPHYFEPRLTPERWLPWLAAWVAQDMDENWSLQQRRELAARAAWLHRWRGTKLGLREFLKLYIGTEPLIVENFEGFRLGPDAVLGVNTKLGQRRPHFIEVTVFLDGRYHVDEAAVARIVEEMKPAHVEYALRVVVLTSNGVADEPLPATVTAAHVSEEP